MSAQDAQPEVLVADGDGVRAITINRPKRLNAVTTETIDAIIRAVETAVADDSFRVITLTGAGRAFSAGADISPEELSVDGLQDDGLGTETIDAANRLALVIRNSPKLVVALVNGPAVGVGSSFVLACDLAFASEAAYLQPGFGAIGLLPDGGGTVFLPAAVGRSRALAITLLGDRVPAEQALGYGMIARVFPADSFPQDAAALVKRLAEGAPRAQAAAKEAVNRVSLPALADALEFEREQQRRLLASGDFAEGVQAFAQKRPARFSGA